MNNEFKYLLLYDYISFDENLFLPLLINMIRQFPFKIYE